MRRPILFNPLSIVGHIVRGLGFPYEGGLLSRHNRDFLDDPDFVRATPPELP